MLGRFDYYLKGCAIPHFLPQGKTANGCPIIVFPQKNTDITVGRQYQIVWKLTFAAEYVADDATYRVAHAISVVDAAFEEGSNWDARKYALSSRSKPATSLADSIDGESANALLALKGQLSKA